MGVLTAENSVHPGRLGLETQRFNIVGSCHQVGFRWQFVGLVAPVSVFKGTQLAAGDKFLQTVLNALEILGAAPGGIANIVSQSRGGLGIGRKRADDIHPVKGMQMIKVHDVVVLELGTIQKVSYNSGIVGNLDADCVFNCPHRGQSMNVSSDAA